MSQNPSMRRYVLCAALLCGVSLAAGTGTRSYEADILRTTYGIPHIRAADYGSLGFGEGYAQAEDHYCTIADQAIRLRGERSLYFGAGQENSNLHSDITMRALDLRGRAADFVRSQPPELRDLMTGYVAGLNRYYELTGRDHVGGWCRGADWVGPVTLEDLGAYWQSILLVTGSFAPQIATAEPPGPGRSEPRAAIEWPLPVLASNGWGLGRDSSAAGRGMLVANPHYPWEGASRFWEMQLEIPGTLRVYGVGLIGIPVVAIGFNQDVAWTHTVSAGKRFTLYTLELVPGQPTSYRYGTEERAMQPKRVSVEVRQPDGSRRTVTRTVWFTHYGPVVNVPGLGWTAQRAVAIRDANWENHGTYAQWLDMDRARSMMDLQAAHARNQALPWVNTIATSREGTAWYTDSSSTPDLSAEALAVWQGRVKTDPVTAMMYAAGVVLLDGSDPRFEWRNDPTGAIPGVVPFARTPQLERTDFVFNANDSFWLANPRALFTAAFSPLHGEARTPRSLRTRNNALTLARQSPGQPAGADRKFTLDELGDALLSNRSLTAELLKDPLVERCSASSTVPDGVNAPDLLRACAILRAWNGRYDVDSRGAVLFREWLAQYAPTDLRNEGVLFAEPFDPADPVNTPRGLAAGNAALRNLANAVRVLNARKLALDVPLGELQFADRHGRRIPIHGGYGDEGLMNVVGYAPNTTTLEPGNPPQPVAGSRTLTDQGYPVNRGTSFLMALEFTASGPHAKAVLAFGESGDYQSSHYVDQTWLFSKKEWRPILFTAEDMSAHIERRYRVR